MLFHHQAGTLVTRHNELTIHGVREGPEIYIVVEDEDLMIPQ